MQWLLSQYAEFYLFLSVALNSHLTGNWTHVCFSDSQRSKVKLDNAHSVSVMMLAPASTTVNRNMTPIQTLQHFSQFNLIPAEARVQFGI